MWIGGYIALGYIFSDQLELLAAFGENLGRWLVVLLISALVLFVGVKYVRRQRFIRQLRIARITPAELRRRIDAGEPVMIVDLRHPVDFEADPSMIPGAIHLAPDEIERRVGEIALLHVTQ